jgi:hypothetical protein
MGGAVSFVFWIDITSKGLALGIEYHRNIAIRVILYQAADHVDHAFYRTRLLTLATFERRQCMKSPE